MKFDFIKKTKVTNNKIYTLKVKTESNNMGLFKTFIVAFLILLQLVFMILSSLYMMSGFKYYFYLSLVLSFISCVYILSSKSNGQTKATWILFLLACYSFGYIIYFFSNDKVLFEKSRKKYKKIHKKTDFLQLNDKNLIINDPKIKSNCNYLINSNFKIYKNSKSSYLSSGRELFDDIISELKNAKSFIFLEFYIISDGVLLKRISDILKQKSSEGVDVRIIYDDMGSHGKFKRKTKKNLAKFGIKLQHFNRLLPIFNLALNLRNHRKIVIIDGKIAYTGGANLADEYINEKQIFGYWKDSGIKIKGLAVDNLTLSFLRQWEILTKSTIEYQSYVNLAEYYDTPYIVAPFVSGPEYEYSIARDMYINLISTAEEKIYITTPYFIPEETITNLLINKAKSGVDVRIILPDIADKRTVYVVSRDYAERLIPYGVKIYTMTNSFVHSKLIYTEHSAIIGSINIDLRSFYQQFESAVYTNSPEVLSKLNKDFNYILENSLEISKSDCRRNKIFYRIFAGILRLISPLM